MFHDIIGFMWCFLSNFLFTDFLILFIVPECLRFKTLKKWLSVICEHGLYFNNAPTRFETVLPLIMSFTNYNQGLLFVRHVLWNQPIPHYWSFRPDSLTCWWRKKWSNDYCNLNTFTPNTKQTCKIEWRGKTVKGSSSSHKHSSNSINPV